MTTKRYTLEDDLRPIMQGKVPLPNPDPIEREIGGAILHYREMLCGEAVLPGDKQWNVRYFLDYGQGGQLYGSGIVAWTTWKDGAYRATGMRFAICKHAMALDAGADPSRGWRPGHCKKCGLDMTVDSGD